MTKNKTKMLVFSISFALCVTTVSAKADNELITLTSNAGELQLPKSHPRLDAARSLVGADWTIENGFTGKGVSIAILDTGIQGDHVQFAGRILAQVCSADSRSTSLCHEKKLSDYTSDSAEYSKNSDGTPLDLRVFHGTAVASSILEFAPDVRIIMLKDDNTNGIFKNLEWVIQNAKKYNIVAVNMSFGNPFQGAPGWPRNKGICEKTKMADDYALPIAKLREMGVAAIVASMNDGNINGISSPACFKNSVSVGAVNSNGSVTDYSNVSNDLTLAAPTEFEAASVAEYFGQKDNWIESFAGTSAATPVVAALFAIGKSIRPKASVSTLFQIARESAIDIEDVIVKDIKLIQFDNFVRMLLDDNYFEQVAKITDAGLNAIKTTSITCVKGKVTKKVTAVKPRCPAGFKIKL